MWNKILFWNFLLISYITCESCTRIWLLFQLLQSIKAQNVLKRILYSFMDCVLSSMNWIYFMCCRIHNTIVNFLCAPTGDSCFLAVWWVTCFLLQLPSSPGVLNTKCSLPDQISSSGPRMSSLTPPPFHLTTSTGVRDFYGAETDLEICL